MSFIGGVLSHRHMDRLECKACCTPDRHKWGRNRQPNEGAQSLTRAYMRISVHTHLRTLLHHLKRARPFVSSQLLPHLLLKVVERGIKLGPLLLGMVHIIPRADARAEAHLGINHLALFCAHRRRCANMRAGTHKRKGQEEGALA
eukprot:487794-Pelagomonas_calceolata.AAC.4